jgi:hypothetical protein
MKILVSIRDQYGAQVIHPVCEKAKAFAALARTKTLTHEAIKQIKALGYQIDVQQTPAQL